MSFPAPPDEVTSYVQVREDYFAKKTRLIRITTWQTPEGKEGL